MARVFPKFSQSSLPEIFNWRTDVSLTKSGAGKSCVAHLQRWRIDPSDYPWLGGWPLRRVKNVIFPCGSVSMAYVMPTPTDTKKLPPHFTRLLFRGFPFPPWSTATTTTTTLHDHQHHHHHPTHQLTFYTIPSNSINSSLCFVVFPMVRWD